MTMQATPSPTAPRRRGDSTTRLLLLGGVVGPALFVVVLLLEGATRPGYSAWRHFGSQLSLSDQGWEQIANFIVCGALCLGFAVALPRALPRSKTVMAGSIALAVFGVSLIAAGVFVTGPALGYPPGADFHSAQSWHAALHGLAGVGAFGSLAVACFIFARSFAGNAAWRGWTAYSIVVGVALALSFVLSNITAVLDMTGAWPNAPTGVIQRVGIVLGWTWVSFLAWRLWRRQSRTARVQASDEQSAGS
jgi:hypothetical protein